ncbi:uncharacterized protein F4822DRAFT_306907 [Hypoxylon trugodes]|uniref:uncharacterized protein n=1 Tax=Hypoxylon trugodes TaxID=326681 RepID=UPI00219A5DB6|nr:uncharacterized protein F4822DRAFT_306907 [Hypoxylon trugodes]KAI1386156.1 hypothetical protein F4822DRAFT_306907 [Hypoxylon trugodes]
MGAPQYSRKASEGAEDTTHVKTEDTDMEMADLDITASSLRDANPLLPPQLLILVLESGELIFLFLQQEPGHNWTFISATHKIPGQRLVYPGFHMAIDPSSTFLAIGCSERLFLMYQLHSMKTLQSQYSRGEPLQPIKDKESRSVSGTIHKMEFLHPTHRQEHQIILMIIMVKKQSSRLVIYEWAIQDDLMGVFLDEKNGYRLDEDYSLPLLVVPLKVRNAFLIITERITATCSDILGSPPVFVPFELANRGDTELHHGTHEPLWTAWTRPIRHPPYHDKKDVIYLAREDGLINFLECGDEFEIETSVSMGSVDCNIDTAFASLFHLFGDVLVTGGDSGPGAVWNVEARQSPQRIGSIPNWSPTVDFVVTDDGSYDDWSSDSSGPGAIIPYKTDKVFACSGRGITGAITQFRYGIQARIGLDLSYSSNIRHCWAISDFHGVVEDGFFLLLALPSGSAILHLSRDLSEVSEKDPESTPFDLSSKTLAVQELDGVVVQITTNCITVSTLTGSSQHSIHDIIQDYTAIVTDAAIRDDTVSLAVHSGPTYKIVLLNITDLDVTLRRTFDVEGEVTCLAIEKLDGNLVVLTGLLEGRHPCLAIYPAELDQASITPFLIELKPPAINSVKGPVDSFGNDPFGALTSFVYLGHMADKAVIIAGTKDGNVLTIRLNRTDSGKCEVYQDSFGTSPSYVYSGSGFGDPLSALVCSDAELAIMKQYVTNRKGGHFEDIYRVWPTDGDRPNMSSPPINCVAPLYNQLPEYGESTMVMISGPRILITELQYQPKPVPRYFPVHGTPVKILHSKKLGALVTVVSKNGIFSLHFLDPETGCDLSRPMERRKDAGGTNYYDVEYISGLGNASTRVMSLIAWTYRYGDSSADWFVVAIRKDNESYLLIISAESEIVNLSSKSSASRRIRFWTKFDRKIRDGPIWSIATDPRGVFLCSGNFIQYHTVDGGKFKMTRTYELISPACWMEVVSGRLYALTTEHSLIILEYKGELTDEEEEMADLCSDDTSRNGLHCIVVETVSSPLSIVSDPMCGIHGLWTPPELRRPLSLVFQAELKASIRKFGRGNTKVSWNWQKYKRARYGYVSGGLPGSDVIGLTIDGSLQHFTLLNEDAWRLLRFIQNLAMAYPKICPHTSPAPFGAEPNPEPSFRPKLGMHVDGDILQRCLDQHVLEEIIADTWRLPRFKELLKPLDDDEYLELDSPASDATYFELAYEILKYYLSPVF